MDSEILKTLENMNMILAPEGLQNISGRQRNPTDIVYSSVRGQMKRKSKPKNEGEKMGAMQLERVTQGIVYTK